MKHFHHPRRVPLSPLQSLSDSQHSRLVVFLRILKISFFCLLAYIASEEKLAVILINIPLCNLFSPLSAFNIYSLSLSLVFSTLIMMCFTLDFFLFILMGVRMCVYVCVCVGMRAFSICGFILFIKFGKFLVVIYSSIFLLPLSHSGIPFIHEIECWMLSERTLGLLIFSYPFCFSAALWKVSVTVSSGSLILSDNIYFVVKLVERIFHFRSCMS